MNKTVKCYSCEQTGHTDSHNLNEQAKQLKMVSIALDNMGFIWQCETCWPGTRRVINALIEIFGKDVDHVHLFSLVCQIRKEPKLLTQPEPDYPTWAK